MMLLGRRLDPGRDPLPALEARAGGRGARCRSRAERRADDPAGIPGPRASAAGASTRAPSAGPWRSRVLGLRALRRPALPLVAPPAELHRPDLGDLGRRRDRRRRGAHHHPLGDERLRERGAAEDRRAPTPTSSCSSREPAGVTADERAGARAPEPPAGRARRRAHRVLESDAPAGGRADGVVVKGIDLARERRRHRRPALHHARDRATSTRRQDRTPGIVLGLEVALRLARRGRATRSSCRSPLRTVSRAARRSIPVAQAVRGGRHLPLRDVRVRFELLLCLDLGRPGALRARRPGDRDRDPPRATCSPPARVGRSRSSAGSGRRIVANNWIDLNRNLFSWMKIEKFVMFLILLLIILVAAFNIASMLFMVVMDKKRDIGVCSSMGATSGAIMRDLHPRGADRGRDRDGGRARSSGSRRPT